MLTDGDGDGGDGGGDGQRSVRERARDRVWKSSPERTEILATVTEAFARDSMTPEAALGAAADVLADLLGDCVLVYLLEGDGPWMRCVASGHCDPAVAELLAALPERRLRADQGFTACVIDNRAPLLIPRITEPELQALQPDLTPASEVVGLKAFILAPLMLRGICLGILAQGRTTPEPALGPDDERFLEEVALRLALGVATWPRDADDCAQG